METAAVKSPVKGRRKGKSLKRMSVRDGIIICTPIILFTLMAIIPFICLISGSFSDSELLEMNGVTLWPRGFTFDAYKAIFMFPEDILSAYGVTILSTALGAFGNVVLLVMLSFALSKPYLKFKGAISFFFFFTIMFNAGIVPNYMMYRNYIRIYDTLWALVLPGLVHVYYIYLLRTFFASVPESLFESAYLDGAGEIRSLISVAVPLIMPGIATISFYSVLMYWNDPSMALYYTESDNLVPLSLYLHRSFQFVEFLRRVSNGEFPGTSIGDMTVPENTVIYSMAIVATGPMLIVFSFFQKYFVRGLSSGAVKG